MTVIRLLKSIGVTVLLCGILCGMGGWCSICASEMLQTSDAVMRGIAGRAFGMFGVVFFGGICLAGLLGYVCLLKEIWRQEDCCDRSR